METAASWFSEIGWKILIIIILFVFLYFLIRRLVPPIIKSSVSVQMRSKPKIEIKKRSETLSRITISVSAVILVIMGLLIILAQAGVDVTAALAGLGIAGIAIGFGAQTLVKDIISGFFILLENQYSVDDVIKVGNTAGIVEEITLRRTILRDLDGARHSIPNGEIRQVSNLTQEWSRAHLNISVAYKEDLDRVMAIMRRIWEEMAQDPKWQESMISKTPSFLRVNEFGDSGIVIKVAGETQPIKQWDVMGELRRRIKRVFDEEGIEIPWPHTKVFFGNSPGLDR